MLIQGMELAWINFSQSHLCFLLLASSILLYKQYRKEFECGIRRGQEYPLLHKKDMNTLLIGEPTGMAREVVIRALSLYGVLL